MNTKYIILFAFIAIPFFTMKAQGPNLTAGVGGIVYNKGQLDAELVMEIVATKQAEIKSEFAKRLILDRFECGSVALYNYVQQNTDLLLSNSNVDVVKKEALKNSAELALVYGIAEFYLQDLARKSRSKGASKLSTEEKNFLSEMARWASLKNRKLIEKKFNYSVDSLVFKEGRKANSQESTVIYNISDFDGDEVKPNFLENPVLLPLFSNSSKYFSEVHHWYMSECSSIASSHIFLDLVYDVCLSNSEIKNAGFLRNIDLSQAEYTSRNKFLRFKGFNDSIYSAFDGIRPRIEKLVEIIFQHYGTLKDLSEFNVGLDSMMVQTMLDSYKAQYSELYNDRIGDLKWDTLRKNFQNQLKQHLSVQSTYKLSESDQELITHIYQLSRTTMPDLSGELSNYRFVLEKSILPRLKTLNVSATGLFDELQVSLEKFNWYLKYNSAIQLAESLGKSNKLSGFALEETNEIVKLLDLLNNIDRVETYDQIFKFLVKAGGAVGNEQSAAVLDFLTSSYDKYTLLNKEENQIEIDVEDIATDLYKRFGESNKSRFGLYFTVGVNYGHYSRKSVYIAKDTLWKGNTANFVSEKIGIRYNIFDWNRKRSFHNYDLNGKSQKAIFARTRKMERAPMVNSLSAIIYGSGLLYQIDFLKSENQFTNPVIGTGLCLTFYNGLDLNASYAIPLNTAWDNGFWNLGFDIRFTEYLSALKRKNK